VIRLSLEQLAEELGGQLEGEGGKLITGVRGLDDAGPSDLSFLSNPRYVRSLSSTRAGVVLVGPGVDAQGQSVIRVSNPYRAFAEALARFHPCAWPVPHVDERAAIAPDAELGDGVCVEPFATIGAGAHIGAGSWVQSGAYVGARSRLGAHCRLMPTAVVMEGCSLGEGVWLNPGAVVGSEGFGFVPDPELPTKIPQVGTVVVGDHVEIGANSCVDRAAMGETRVERGARLDNLCQVGHGAVVGPASLMVAYSGVAGSAKLGRAVTLAARVSVLGHLRIGDGVRAGAHSMVSKDVEAGGRVSGVPARDHGQWLKERVAAQEMDGLIQQVSELQDRIRALEEK
jgi:UDP-3-O-[3-hydroxymyristoyl] glucosamine N-acyltransferase